MAKGVDDDTGTRSAAAIGVASDPPPGAPGKSTRARHTYLLLAQAGGFDEQYLLRDVLGGTGRTLPAAKADAKNMTHNALMAWLPAGYSGHDGHDPHAEDVRAELFYMLLLDGDRRADHTYFYRAPSSKGGEWTLASGRAVAAWYSIPVDDTGRLNADTLAEAVAAAPGRRRELFVDALRARPLDTLAQCAPAEPGALADDMFGACRDLPEDVRRAVAQRLGDVEDAAEAAAVGIRARDALRLAAKAGLSDGDRDVLLQACAYAPVPGQDAALAAERARAQLGAGGQRAAAIIEEMQANRSVEGLPVLEPESALGKLAADATQSFLACEGGDRVARRYADDLGLGAGVEAVDRLRDLCARTPWHSQPGRALMAAAARRQETRLRSLLGLALGAHTPKAPKGTARLRRA